MRLILFDLSAVNNSPSHCINHAVSWNPALVAPNGSSKRAFVSEWAGGENYVMKVQSEKGDIMVT